MIINIRNEKEGYEILDYEYSDAGVIERIKANCLEFFENGDEV
jgi:hypothetical protein